MDNRMNNQTTETLNSTRNRYLNDINYFNQKSPQNGNFS